MELGSQENEVHSLPEQGLHERFMKTRPGASQYDLGYSSGQSLNESFRMSSSAVSVKSISRFSSPGKVNPATRRMLKTLKDYRRKLVNLDLFVEILEDWVSTNMYSDSHDAKQSFTSPFSIDELLKLDLALEGVLFQQLCRMPCSPFVSVVSKEDEFLAIEDFLHGIVKGLWHTFWRKSQPLPFVLSYTRHPRSKFYSLERAISRGRLEELHGLALIPKSDPFVEWDQILEFVLVRPDILSGKELRLSSSTICEALFYGFHILIARRLGNNNLAGSDSVFLLVFDTKFGGVIKLGGDIGKLELTSANLYVSVGEWIKCHAEIEVSSVDRVWNKLGNANWGDLGTLQVLLATYYSMVQWNGPPRKSIATLASNHSLRLHKRRLEWGLLVNENALVPFHQTVHQEEIVEVNHSGSPSIRKHTSRLQLKPGDVLQLDVQQQGQKGFQIHDSLIGGNCFLYIAVRVDCPTELLSLYVGAHPSRLEPSWEDMSLWYQVQRQTKVLNMLKQHGVVSRYLPELVASGRLLHSGPCKKQTPGGRCDHPWCGTPVLVTSPVGEALSLVFAQYGPFSSEEAVRCCRDCLDALRCVAMANIQHGDVCPDNILRVFKPAAGTNGTCYVPISWGRAVLEDRDSPAINLQFSSSHALQNGKLCPSSDAESLMYLIFFVCGGTMEQQDSIESALQWRERSWAKRVIQQKLGEVSPLLKAFADYVDSLCGTPYQVDYGIWLKRLSRAIDGSVDRGKKVAEPLSLTLEEVGEYSGTSGGGI